VATNAEDYIDSQILASENVTTITIGACKTISILLQTRQNIILSEVHNFLMEMAIDWELETHIFDN
tara:strand:+ start:320 stop:517 length:198 start_codon:yes stop_codon:yes gene_type:complete